MRSTYWFIPVSITLFLFLLSEFFSGLDKSKNLPAFLEEATWVYRATPDGARAVLSTMASSLITITGVTFSITVVALSLTMTQFGPRLIRNFMLDNKNQVVLGMFIGTSIYCLSVLRSSPNADSAVPFLSISVAFALTFTCLILFVYFLHHITTSLNADHVIESAGRMLSTNLNRLPDLESDHSAHEVDFAHEPDVPIRAHKGGYIQAVDFSTLVAKAADNDMYLRVIRRPGQFVLQGSIVLYASKTLEDEHIQQILNTFIIGKGRTEEQDLEYGLRQLVEIALRALSPGINDSFTAIACVDRIGETLAGLFGKRLPSDCIHDENNTPRIMREVSTISGLIETSFNQIRQSARENVAVSIRILGVLRELAEIFSYDARAKEALTRQIEAIQRCAKECSIDTSDLEDLEKVYEQAKEAIQA